MESVVTNSHANQVHRALFFVTNFLYCSKPSLNQHSLMSLLPLTTHKRTVSHACSLCGYAPGVLSHTGHQLRISSSVTLLPTSLPKVFPTSTPPLNYTLFPLWTVRHTLYTVCTLHVYTCMQVIPVRLGTIYSITIHVLT